MKDHQPSVPRQQAPKELQDHWPKISDKPAVFLAKFEISAKHPFNTTKKAWQAALFGGTGPADKSGWTTTEFLVVEIDGNTRREHHLSQSGDSTAYQTKQESKREAGEPPEMTRIQEMTPEIQELLEFGGDIMTAMEHLTGASNEPQSWWNELLVEYKAAGKPKAKKKWLSATLAPRFKWISQRPRWTEDEGEWCFIASKPMIFLGQTAVPEGTATPKDAPAGQMIYLFVDQTTSGREFKVISQTCGEQTAEDHYRLEEQIARFYELGGGPEAAKELAKKGDKWAHRFLLDCADLAKAALELLAKHGATGKLKEEAKARLKESGAA